MNKPITIGKNHVLHVSQALKATLDARLIEEFSEPVIETVNFIQNLYPNIDAVVNKYETPQPDNHPDLLLTLTDGRKESLNLFTIKGSAAIQPKNLGAKSFLKKYFDSNDLQVHFNDYLKKEYKRFLKDIISLQDKSKKYHDIPTLKKAVNAYYPKFDTEIKPIRRKFLFNLREYCFDLLKDEYNMGTKGIQYAFNELMMTSCTTIITRYTNKNKCLSVDQWKSTIDSREGIQIYKKGNDTVGIRAGSEALTLRFKFESSPNSSIKLATSYELFPEEKSIVAQNLQSVAQFEGLLAQHICSGKKVARPNAIGKCNEAMVYYRLLKENPTANQVDREAYTAMLTKYYALAKPKELTGIHTASAITTQKIYQYLKEKYGNYEIQEIQLVGDIYIKNPTDTSDLQLVLIVNKKYMIESLSLKASAKRNAEITSKNPGAGQILGPKYFDIGSLDELIKDAKYHYQENVMNHRQVMELISKEIGRVLVKAPQEKVKKGLRMLLGDKIVVLTIYMENECVLLEHAAVKGRVEIHPETPSSIQTTLRWNHQQEELAMRVKFSGGQERGWSSLKLACNYRVK